MANRKISELDEIEELQTGDSFVVVDASENLTKQIKYRNFNKIWSLDVSSLDLANNSTPLVGPAAAITTDEVLVILPELGLASGANHSFEKVLTSTSGDFLINLQLQESAGTLLESGTLGIVNGEVVVGDGVNDPATLLPLGVKEKRIYLNQYYKPDGSNIINSTGFANVNGSVLADTVGNTGSGFFNFYNNPAFEIPIYGNLSGINFEISFPSSKFHNGGILTAFDSGTSSELYPRDTDLTTRPFSSLLINSFYSIEGENKINIDANATGLSFSSSSFREDYYFNVGLAPIASGVDFIIPFQEVAFSQNLKKDDVVLLNSLSLQHPIFPSRLKSDATLYSTGVLKVWFFGDPVYEIKDAFLSFAPFAGLSSEQASGFLGNYVPSGTNQGKTQYYNNNSGVVKYISGNNDWGLFNVNNDSEIITNIVPISDRNFKSSMYAGESYDFPSENSQLGFFYTSTKPPAYIDVKYNYETD